MKIFKILSVISLFAVAAAAQDDTIRVATNLVTLNVSVADKKGKAATGLKLSDFRLTDNGKAQEIETFSDAAAPVSYGIVYDQHPTTDDQARSVLAALKQFTSKLGGSDDFFVTVFNDRGSLTTEFVPTVEQIGNQDGGGATSLFDAIFAASGRMSQARNNKRVLLVLTDGADHNSQHSYKELRNHLRSVNLPVYAITFSNRDRTMFGYSDIFRDGPRGRILYGEADALDRGAIAELSKTSGGQAYDGNMRNQVYLAAVCTMVGEEVRSQYVLGFYPDALDGKYHKLGVTVVGQKEKKLKISSRKGYQSPRKG
ncbi:MAG: VWA domain-containing protein [Pyrinomonadaceae bacterium]|nr:VWA domain-containing protein [Chloracidobacterium sp.]MBP7416746.1 VWA domain-containing protein [Pyrinomonadaceae bacterium]